VGEHSEKASAVIDVPSWNNDTNSGKRSTVTFFLLNGKNYYHSTHNMIIEQLGVLLIAQ